MDLEHGRQIAVVEHVHGLHGDQHANRLWQTCQPLAVELLATCAAYADQAQTLPGAWSHSSHVRIALPTAKWDATGPFVPGSIRHSRSSGDRNTKATSGPLWQGALL